jgi:RNase H-fold protein (predicted Holliday junction resolvase)
LRVLAVDPGREKCGVAVCGPEGVIARRVVGVDRLRDLTVQYIQDHAVEQVVVGDGTGYKQMFAILEGLKVPVRLVAERGSTLGARLRYFRDHPPRGWRRLLPLSLQVPPEPYDDYAAQVLGERYLGKLQADSEKVRGRP